MRLSRFSDKLKFQDRAECGKNQVLRGIWEAAIGRYFGQINLLLHLVKMKGHDENNDCNIVYMHIIHNAQVKI